ncbi:MAG: DUF3168 domain-containing protein [Rhizobiaceae bacterium]|nr:DUF3168 domain-containing protein [Rhizobiaceae bacterium]
MASADLELQGAIVARLKAYQPIIDIVGTRPGYGTKVFDKPPADAGEPYVSVDGGQSLRRDAECIDGQEIYISIHAWSIYSGGFMEVKQMTDAVVQAVHQHPFSLATNRLVSISHRQTRTMRDADGTTSHAVIEFVAFVERL